VGCGEVIQWERGLKEAFLKGKYQKSTSHGAQSSDYITE
jgi:hypothetical protein